MSLNLNIKQVKGNLQRLFDKNLTDLVRGLRNNKDNEVQLRNKLNCYINLDYFFRTSTSANSFLTFLLLSLSSDE